MSYLHTSGTVYDTIPKGVDASEFIDIGERPSGWHYWNGAEWVEDTTAKLAFESRGW